MMFLALRHLRRHWRINGIVLLYLTLAAALLAGLSGYTTAVATRELQQTLGEARPAERSLLIEGGRTTFSEDLYELFQERMGEAVQDRLVIRHATSPADTQPAVEGAEPRQAVALLDIYSFDRLPEIVRVVEGRLPESVRLREAQDAWRPPPIEAVIGASAAEQSGYAIGDRLTGSGTYHRLDIVGIVEPIDPTDDVWGEDWSAFVIATDTLDLPAELIALPLIVANGSMRSSYPQRPIFWHEVSWRITLNHHLVRAGNAEALHAGLVNVQAQSATRGATISTGLMRTLADYLARLSRVRMAFLLLIAQTLFFVLYTLAMFTSLLVDRSQTEWETLSARGASTWQIVGVLALKNSILALPALLLGLGLAQGAIYVWGRSADEAMLNTLPGEAWLLAGIAVGLGWLALVLPVLLAARRGALGRQPLRAQPAQRSLVQRHYLDLYLLAFSSLLYWQLSRSGSFVMRRLGETSLADPLLLIGPSLLLIAAAIVSLRVVPLLWRLVAWVFRHVRGAALSLSMFRMARDPLQSGNVVLLVSLATGLVLFTRAFGISLADSQGALRTDALAQGVSDALQLNALVLLLFSATTLFLVYFVAAQGRAREFGVLQALGLSARQQLAMLTVEGVLVLLLGLLGGILIGWGLSHIMIPYLAQALAESLASEPVERILIDGPTVARLVGQLAAMYGAALALLGFALARTRAHRARWMEDE